MPQADSRSTTPKISLPKAIPPAAREKVEAAIEAHIAAQAALIAFLDAADGDVEDHDDELDQDVADEPHDADDENEPSLAHTLDINQERASRHLQGVWSNDNFIQMGQDLEAEHDGREPDNDGEDNGDREP